MKFRTSLFIATVSILLVSCSASMPPLVPSANPSPLVVASCPPPAPLLDPSFGATTEKLIELATLYRQCRAALALDP